MVLTGLLGRTVLKLIELFNIKKVNSVQVFTCKNTESVALYFKDGPSLDIYRARFGTD